jgi:RNA polymerase sigma-70 factor, ECF subfamily
MRIRPAMHPLAGVQSALSLPTHPEDVSGPPEFRAVFDEHAAFVWRILVRLGVPRDDLDDVCQEVFLIVHRRLPEFDGRQGSIRTWLYRICAHIASDYRKRAHRSRETAMQPLPEVEVQAPQEARAETHDYAKLLDALLAKIDEAPRLVFVLHDIEQMPMVEVAAVLGCPLQTGYSRLRAARRDLEALLHAARARREIP